MKPARLILLPWFVLVAGLGLTWLVWDHERQATRTALQSQFDFSLREAVSRVEQRVSANAQMLRGVQGLFAGTRALVHDAINGYVGSLQLDANYSGIEAIGVVERVPDARRDAHVAAMRRTGLRDYAIRPTGRREGYAPVIQVVSYAGHRDRVGLDIGFDAGTDSVLRVAMELARDSGFAAMSGKIQLAVDAGSGATPGFVMYLPIYAQDEPIESIALRRANLVAWVYASFRMNDLMASLYGEQQPGLVFAIHDGVAPSDAALLYTSAGAGSQRRPAAIAADEYLVVAGHTWTLAVRTGDDFEAHHSHDAAPLIASAGTGLSVLLALLAWLLVTGRTRALHLAAGMTRELRASEEKFQSLFELSPDAIVVVTRAGSIRNVNRQAERLFGYARVELIGQMIEILIPAAFGPEHVANRESYSRDPQLRAMGEACNLLARRKDGTECPVDVNLSPLATPDGTMVISTIRDITERRQLETEVRQLAFHDPLTRLPNRRLLYEHFSRAMAASRRSGRYCALMFLDLDHFKELNDSRGHPVGDSLLVEVGKRLRGCSRETDTVARVGGDEFVVMLGDLGTDKDESAIQAGIVAEKIRIALSQPYLLAVKCEGQADSTIAHHCTTSIGVALFFDHAATRDDILKWADMAMYRAKVAGGDAIRFFDAMV